MGPDDAYRQERRELQCLEEKQLRTEYQEKHEYHARVRASLPCLLRASTHRKSTCSLIQVLMRRNM